MPRSGAPARGGAELREAAARRHDAAGGGVAGGSREAGEGSVVAPGKQEVEAWEMRYRSETVAAAAATPLTSRWTRRSIAGGDAAVVVGATMGLDLWPCG